MVQSTGASSTNSGRQDVTLSEAEIERRIQAFKRIAFTKLFVGGKAMSAYENDESNQVAAVMRSMVLLANDILRPHDASVVLTRTEEDSEWGTQVYVRLACKDESNEQTLLQHLVDTTKRDACLMRPTLIESQLDGTLEVRMRVPSAEHAKTLAWAQQKERLRRPLFFAAFVAFILLSGMAYLYHVAHAPHDEL